MRGLREVRSEIERWRGGMGRLAAPNPIQSTHVGECQSAMVFSTGRRAEVCSRVFRAC